MSTTTLARQRHAGGDTLWVSRSGGDMVRATINEYDDAEGILIPPGFCKKLGLSVGDNVQVTVEDSRIVIEPWSDPCTIDNLLKGWRGGRYHSPEIDWGPPAGKEMW